jgi:hypothetical protein
LIGVYPFPLLINPGAVLEYVGRENWIELLGFNAGPVPIMLEKEGWVYFHEDDGVITTKPG